MAIGAGKLCQVFLATSALPTMKVWTMPGFCMPTPPGTLNPLRSQGATASGPVASQARARATTSSGAAVS